MRSELYIFPLQLETPTLNLDLKAYSPLMASMRFHEYIQLSMKSAFLFLDTAANTTNVTRVAIEMTDMALLERRLNKVSPVLC